MPMTEKKRKTDSAWQMKNYKRIGAKLYKKDAEAFENFCKERGKSVNSVLRDFVADCIGRPLERRTEKAEERPPE